MESLIRVEESLIRVKSRYESFYQTLSATVECDGRVFEYTSGTYYGFTPDQARKDFLEDLTRQGLKLVREL